MAAPSDYRLPATQLFVVINTGLQPDFQIVPRSTPSILTGTVGEATVSQLAEPFAITQQAISKHLKVLERAGLITRSRTAQSRPCRLEPERLDTAAEWIGRHRQVWAERSDRLDDHLAVLRREQEQQEHEQKESGT